MMHKFYKKSFATIHRELQDQFQGRAPGHRLAVPVGDRLFPGSLPPQLEIILLDTEEMTVAFRKISAARGRNHRKGEWHVGPISSAAEKIIAWVDQMISLKSSKEVYEVKEI